MAKRIEIIMRLPQQQDDCAYCNRSLATQELTITCYNYDNISVGWLRYELPYCESCNIAFADSVHCSDLQRLAAPQHVCYNLVPVPRQFDEAILHEQQRKRDAQENKTDPKSVGNNERNSLIREEGSVSKKTSICIYGGCTEKATMDNYCWEHYMYEHSGSK